MSGIVALRAELAEIDAALAATKKRADRRPLNKRRHFLAGLVKWADEHGFGVGDDAPDEHRSPGA